MARSSHLSPSRYQRDQRFTVVSWVVIIVIGPLAGAYHYWASARSDSQDTGAIEQAGSAPPSMRMWLDESEPSINGLVTARNTIAAAAAHQDIAGTGAACQSATTAVADLRVKLPSPEPVVNSLLQQAISSYTTGLPYCVIATKAADGEGLQRAAGYISEGDTAMQGCLDVLGNEEATQPGNLGVLIV